MKEQKKFYVTTPIYYGTGKPHLGTLYTTVLADVIARWQQLDGAKTFLLTGTDEHGHKIAEAAQKAGKDPKTFVDSFVADYKKAWTAYNIQYTKFLRTTDPDHKRAVLYFINELKKTGDIYKDSYHGWYCSPCESFVIGKQEPGEVGPACPQCGRLTHYVSEPCYFFKLSAYQERLLKFFKENPNFITPKERLNEVVAFVESGLKDLSISRSTVKWGIPFPDDPEQIVYVWADALTNYISAVGYGDPARAQEFAQWWPADVHIMAKDIVRFHAVYWVAFLMAAKLALPKRLLVHGWITNDGRKMSKSFGNVIDPVQLQTVYGADPVRYYLASRLSVAQDANFSTHDLEQVITSDLANEFGNLLNRVLVLAQKNECLALGQRSSWSSDSSELMRVHDALVPVVREHMSEYTLHLACAEIKRFTAQVNAYVHARQPWVQAKDNKEDFVETITAVVSCVYMIAYLLWPVMPATMERVLSALGVQKEETLDSACTSAWNRSYTLTVIPPLFEKLESSTVVQAPVVEQKPTAPEIPVIDITDLEKIHTVVGTIVSAEPVSHADKLLKLMVDCGPYGMRQILAGVRAYFTPYELVGKQGVFVVNLKPRMMRGLESQGMMLVVEHEGRRVLVQPTVTAIPGSRLH